jgi:hypothetical protein
LVNQILGYKEEVDAVDTSWRGKWEPAPRSKTTQEGRSKGAAPNQPRSPADLGRSEEPQALVGWRWRWWRILRGWYYFTESYLVEDGDSTSEDDDDDGGGGDQGGRATKGISHKGKNLYYYRRR